MGRQIVTKLTRAPSTPSGIIKVENFFAIPEVLCDLGIKVEPLLTRVAIDRNLFSDRDNVVALSALGRLTNECVKLSGCEDFGLRVGMKMRSSSLGLVGFTLLNSKTVREALQVLVDHLKLTVTGVNLFVNVQKDATTLSLVLTHRRIAASDQIVDASLAVSCNILRELIGPDWRPKRALLTRQKPGDPQPFLDFFQAPVLFNAPIACLIFNAADLDLPIIGRNAELYAFLSRLLDKTPGETGGSFSSKVRTLLLNGVSNGLLTKKRAASAFGMSERTFARRLAGEGVSYSDLADQAKCEIAERLLSQGTSITDIASHLGYADASAFSRAFKHWSGMAPARWRTEEQG
jgi:AraC-like DNA-binding protein